MTKKHDDFPTAAATQGTNGASAPVASPASASPDDTADTPFRGVPYAPAPDPDLSSDPDNDDDTSILKRLRLAEAEAEDLDVEREPDPVCLRKPSSMEWIRVRPGNRWRISAYLLTPPKSRVTYLVMDDALIKQLKRKKQGRAAIIYTTMDRDGSLFLWPVGMPNGVSGRNEWNVSAHKAATLATTTWVQLISNQGRGFYEIEKTSRISEPTWPDRPTFGEMLHEVFGDLMIEGETHEVIQHLWGL
jgi:hypothetical protein